jgi:hypothetical protein
MAKPWTWLLLSVVIAAGVCLMGLVRADADEEESQRPRERGEQGALRAQESEAPEGPKRPKLLEEGLAGPRRMLPEEWPARFPRGEERQRPTPPAPPALERPRPDIDLILFHARRLALTREQVAELRERRLEARLKAVELNAQREQAHLRLEASLDQEQVDLEAVRKLLHSEAEAEAELRYLDIELSVRARGLLDPEQRRRLDEIAAAWQPEPPGAFRPRVPGMRRRPKAPEQPEAE